MADVDWKILGQLVVYAFGAGGVVQQLRSLNKTVGKLETRLDLAITSLTERVNDLSERTSSLEEFRRFMSGDGR